MHEHLRKRLVTAGTVASAADLSAAKKLTLDAVHPCHIVRWGLLAVTAITTDTFVLELNFRSTVGAGDTQIQTMTPPAVSYAVGTLLFADVAVPVAEANGDDTLSFGGGVTPQTSKINVDPTGPLIVLPGQSADVEVTNAAGAGTAIFFIEFWELDFVMSNAGVPNGAHAVKVAP